MKGRIRRPLLLALALWLCLASAALAQTVGRMTVEKGQVKLRRAGAETVYAAAAEPVPLQEGDVLQSARDTRATLRFKGGDQTVSLYSSTYFTVKNVQPQRSFFGLTVGKAVFAVLRLLRTQRFDVETPTATIGVKGTEFVVGSDGVSNTYVLTLSGVVGLTTLTLPQEVLVGRNQASFSTRGEPPAPPVDVPDEVRNRIVGEEGLEPFEEVPGTRGPGPGPGRRRGRRNGNPEETREAVDDARTTITDSTETVTAPRAEGFRIKVLR